MVKGEKGSVDQRRAAMPATAAFIDMCREAYGAELVNRQLATAQQAAREYREVLSVQGEVAARSWHRANAHRCTFVAAENSRTLGLASPWGAR